MEKITDILFPLMRKIFKKQINQLVYNYSCKYYGLGIKAKTENKISELKPVKLN